MSKYSDLAVSGGVGCGGTEPISVCPTFGLMVLFFRAATSCLASLSFRIKSWSLWISSPLLLRLRSSLAPGREVGKVEQGVSTILECWVFLVWR